MWTIFCCCCQFVWNKHNRDDETHTHTHEQNRPNHAHGSRPSIHQWPKNYETNVVCARTAYKFDIETELLIVRLFGRTKCVHRCYFLRGERNISVVAAVLFCTVSLFIVCSIHHTHSHSHLSHGMFELRSISYINPVLFHSRHAHEKRENETFSLILNYIFVEWHINQLYAILLLCAASNSLSSVSVHSTYSFWLLINFHFIAFSSSI